MNKVIEKGFSWFVACCVVGNTVILLHKEPPHIHPEQYHYNFVNTDYSGVSSASTENLNNLRL